ncbi:MAG: ArsR family transcriptional regulator, partial [Anaerolineae bacterium]|nr:ArsR family transcriptional regulator [Anaerolineae bacterium]
MSPEAKVGGERTPSRRFDDQKANQEKVKGRSESSPSQPQDPRLSEGFRALGSDTRIQILRQLMQGDQGVPELAAVLNLHPVTVRYHINILLREGLIDQLSYRREGVPGRPEIHYRLRPERLVAGFPPRQYQLLSDILLQLIVGSLDPRRRREALYAAGRRGGEELIQGIERSAQLSVWNPERFVHLFLQGALLEMGLQTELLELREDGVHYRLFTCPFQEIA